MQPFRFVVLIAAAGWVASRAEAAEVAILTTDPRAGRTELSFHRVGEEKPPRPVAEFRHAPGGPVLGATLPGTRTVLAIAGQPESTDDTFSSALYRLDEGRPAVMLAEGLYTSTRPLVTQEGRVFVLRGEPGPALSSEQIRARRLREDWLRIEEVNPAGGPSLPLYQFQGYMLFPAGAFGSELILYRVKFRHADLVAVDVNTGKSRTLLARMTPMARDFSVDTTGAALLFTQWNARERTWQVERLALQTRSREVLLKADKPSLAAAAWPGKGLAFNASRGGLTTARGAQLFQGMGAPRSLQAKSASAAADVVDRVRGYSVDKRLALVVREESREEWTAWVVRTDDGESFPLKLEPSLPFDVAGWVEAP